MGLSVSLACHNCTGACPKVSSIHVYWEYVNSNRFC